MKKDFRITKHNPNTIKNLIETRDPKGLFYCIETREWEGNNVGWEEKVYVAVDNSTGDAWVDEFPDLRSCRRWLLRNEKQPKRPKKPKPKPKALYLCDRKACSKPSSHCGVYCFHTSDLKHAISFEKDGAWYFERRENHENDSIYKGEL